MPHAYTEDQQAQRTLTRPLPEGEEVEPPAIGLFAELGWTTVFGLQNLRRTRDPAAAGLPSLRSGQVELKSAEKI